MNRFEKMHGKPGAKYGIYNKQAKKFQFGICEDTPMLAEARLWQKIGDGVDTFVEIGPGKTLEGFLRKIDRSVKVFHISQWEDVDKVCTELADSGKMMEEA